MEIPREPDPPEQPFETQAQIAAFADVIPKAERHHVFSQIGELAMDFPQEVVRPANEYNLYETGLDKVTVTTRDDFENWLNNEGSKNPDVTERVQALHAYQPFSDQVHSLQREVAQTGAEATPGYLGSGDFSDVFAIEHDGKEVVVRIPRKTEHIEPAQLVDGHALAFLKGRNIDGLEQLIGFSYVDGVTITERVPGRTCSTLTAEELEHVTDAQLTDALSTFENMHDRGLRIDGRASNILYDAENGFGFIDYIASVRNDIPNFFVLKVEGLIKGITGQDRSWADLPAGTPEQTAIRRQLLERLDVICQERYPDKPELNKPIAKTLQQLA